MQNITETSEHEQVLSARASIKQNERERQKKLAQRMKEDDDEFSVGGDTFAMAFKAFHRDSARQLMLTPLEI